MNELLGFLVLSAPLVFIVLWILVGLPIAFIVSKRLTDEESNKKKRLLKGLVIATVVFLLPFADAIVGTMYFNYLCHFEGGPKVYQKVGLPAEYWDERGDPKFIKKNGDLDNIILNNRFSHPGKTTSYSKVLGIEKSGRQFVDNNTRDILGEVVTFMHWGGWISRNLTTSKKAKSCPNYSGSEFWENFHRSVFKIAKLTND